jgi:hypothetical protein
MRKFHRYQKRMPDYSLFEQEKPRCAIVAMFKRRWSGINIEEGGSMTSVSAGWRRQA